MRAYLVGPVQADERLMAASTRRRNAGHKRETRPGGKWGAGLPSGGEQHSDRCQWCSLGLLCSVAAKLEQGGTSVLRDTSERGAHLNWGSL